MKKLITIIICALLLSSCMKTFMAVAEFRYVQPKDGYCRTYHNSWTGTTGYSDVPCGVKK